MPVIKIEAEIVTVEIKTIIKKSRKNLSQNPKAMIGPLRMR